MPLHVLSYFYERPVNIGAASLSTSINFDGQVKIRRILTLTWGLTRYKSGFALSLSLSSICLRISSLLMLLRILTSSLDNGAVAVSWIGCATSGSDFFRWRGIAATGIACTKEINEKQKERDGPRARDANYLSILCTLTLYIASNGFTAEREK